MLRAGYGYCFTGDGKWSDSPSDDWDATIISGGKADYLGTRQIDGEMCTVWQRGEHVYAQLAHVAPAPKSGGKAKATSSGPVVHLERLKLNRGGYTSAGRYFGVGAPLFEYANDDYSIHGHVRAKDRTAAKAEVLAKHPGVKVK